MSRILTRPMFRKGGLSQTARPSYRGGGVTAIRPGYRGGGMNGIMSGIVPRRGYADGPATPEEILERIQVQGLPYLTLPKIEDKYQSFIKRQDPITFPEEGALVSGYGEGKEALYDFYQTPEGEKYFKEPLIKKMEEQVAKRKAAGLDVSDDAIVEEPEKTIIENGSDTSVSGEPIQSDLESLQDYMKMFEAAAAGDPDEARKSKYLELAKFGSNILAQPGGDLVGAIGKAASSSIGGLSKQMAADRAAKQQAKLVGLKVGAEAMGGGEFGRKINTLARLTGKSKEAIAQKFLAGDYDFDKEYLAAAEASGVEIGEPRKIYLRNIKIMSNKNPEIAARLNKPFPKKNAVEGEYYVLPGGEFTRFVDGEKLTPTDPGFYDKEV